MSGDDREAGGADTSSGDPTDDAAQRADAVVVDRTADLPPSRSVVRAVAATTGRPPMALRPLHDVTDPDSLDRLIRSTDRERASPGCVVAFRYEGCEVVVSADGRTVVVPPTGRTVVVPPDGE